MAFAVMAVFDVCLTAPVGLAVRFLMSSASRSITDIITVSSTMTRRRALSRQRTAAAGFGVGRLGGHFGGYLPLVAIAVMAVFDMHLTATGASVVMSLPQIRVELSPEDV
jgi:hypothetical protein